MENATKALLISAAVLIVIVIIALGVSLLKSVSNTTIQSQSIGEIIGNATNNASRVFKGKLLQVETIKNMSSYGDYYGLNEVLAQNKTREKIKVAGFIYKTISEWDDEHGEWSAFKDTCLATKDGETEYEKSQRIVDSDIYNSKDFIMAKDIFKIKEETKEYLDKNVQNSANGQLPHIYAHKFYTHYDNEGYIDEIVFVCFGGVGQTGFYQQPFVGGAIF